MYNDAQYKLSWISTCILWFHQRILLCVLSYLFFLWQSPKIYGIFFFAWVLFMSIYIYEIIISCIPVGSIMKKPWKIFKGYQQFLDVSPLNNSYKLNDLRIDLSQNTFHQWIVRPDIYLRGLIHCQFMSPMSSKSSILFKF